MEEEADVALVRVAQNMFEASRIEAAGTADDAVHLVAFFEEQLGEVGAILAGDARDEGLFRFCHRCMVASGGLFRKLGRIIPALFFAPSTHPNTPTNSSLLGYRIYMAR